MVKQNGQNNLSRWHVCPGSYKRHKEEDEEEEEEVGERMYEVGGGG